MKYSLSNLRPTTGAVLATLALLLSVSTIHAQSGNRNEGPPVPGSPKPGDELRPSSIRERQFRMMEMEREAAKPRSPEEEKLAVAQIADDYKQIQIINNKMMSALVRADSPNYANISATLSEIRKRAMRLKDNLRLTTLEMKGDSEVKHKQALSALELKSDLLTLDKSIMSFVGNAIFKNPEVVNVEEATKARRDLEFVIAKSQMISKDADLLNKSSKKP